MTSATICSECGKKVMHKEIRGPWWQKKLLARVLNIFWIEWKSLGYWIRIRLASKIVMIGNNQLSSSMVAFAF